MRLERDEFVITYDPLKTNENRMLTTFKDAGYRATIVTNVAKAEAGTALPAPVADPPFFTEALAQAKRERKPVVLEFYAEWCAPCKRMLKETFAEPKVAALLERCVLLKIDTDRYPGLAKKCGVVSLPDVRLLAPDGSEKKRLLDFQSPETFTAELQQLLDLGQRK
jgi:thiol:disulfide interchange protein DsbD